MGNVLELSQLTEKKKVKDYGQENPDVQYFVNFDIKNLNLKNQSRGRAVAL